MIERIMARYGAAIAAGTFIGWLAPGMLSLPVGAAAAAGAYAAARAVTPSKGVSSYE
jgi:hypothetical protein